MMTNEREAFELLKWLSKAIIAVNWFSRGVQAGIIFAEHINECNCIQQTSYYMCDKTPEHALKTKFGIFILVYAEWIYRKNILRDTNVSASTLLE